MRVIFGCLLLVLLFSCSDNAHQCDTKKIVVDDNSSQIPVSSPVKESIPRKTCTIVRVDYESMCDIYTLDCEGETEYALICRIKPSGKITNPPRPIKIMLK